mmetsp:Transcript_32957/g.106462  ORF Transcript_32957/g.106462 Transcript_32957/m.106462 type:complete len:252 (+) Transcript_32957:221-976(+)
MQAGVSSGGGGAAAAAGHACGRGCLGSGGVSEAAAAAVRGAVRQSAPWASSPGIHMRVCAQSDGTMRPPPDPLSLLCRCCCCCCPHRCCRYSCCCPHRFLCSAALLRPHLDPRALAAAERRKLVQGDALGGDGVERLAAARGEGVLVVPPPPALPRRVRVDAQRVEHHGETRRPAERRLALRDELLREGEVALGGAAAHRLEEAPLPLPRREGDQPLGQLALVERAARQRVDGVGRPLPDVAAPLRAAVAL